MATNEAHDGSVSRERDVVHQPPHEEDSEAASTVIGLDGAAVAGRGEPLPAVADFDGELLSVKPALDAKPAPLTPAAVLHRVAQRLAGSQTDIRNLAFRETAGAGKAGNATTR